MKSLLLILKNIQELNLALFNNEIDEANKIIITTIDLIILWNLGDFFSYSQHGEIKVL